MMWGALGMMWGNFRDDVGSFGDDFFWMPTKIFG